MDGWAAADRGAIEGMLRREVRRRFWVIAAAVGSAVGILVARVEFGFAPYAVLVVNSSANGFIGNATREAVISFNGGRFEVRPWSARFDTRVGGRRSRSRQ